jgi:phosphopantetheinyl transferase (holo-ACP synthase)
MAAQIAQQLGIDEVLISISQCRTHATAFAMAIRGDAEMTAE